MLSSMKLWIITCPVHFGLGLSVRVLRTVPPSDYLCCMQRQRARQYEDAHRRRGRSNLEHLQTAVLSSVWQIHGENGFCCLMLAPGNVQIRLICNFEANSCNSCKVVISTADGSRTFAQEVTVETSRSGPYAQSCRHDEADRGGVMFM